MAFQCSFSSYRRSASSCHSTKTLTQGRHNGEATGLTLSRYLVRSTMHRRSLRFVTGWSSPPDPMTRLIENTNGVSSATPCRSYESGRCCTICINSPRDSGKENVVNEQ